MAQQLFVKARKPLEPIAIVGTVLGLMGLAAVCVWAVFMPLTTVLAILALPFTVIGMVGGAFALAALVCGVIGLVLITRGRRVGIAFALSAVVLGLGTISWATSMTINAFHQLASMEQVRQESVEEMQARMDEMLAHEIDVQIGEPVIAEDGLSGFVPVTIADRGEHGHDATLVVEQRVPKWPFQGIYHDYIFLWSEPGEVVEFKLFEVTVKSSDPDSAELEREKLEQLKTSTFRVISASEN